jgi:hypothetical protein
MSDIKGEPGWDKRGFPANLESRMDFAEHQRIVFKALQLLDGDLAVADNAAGEKLEQLKEAYESSDPSDVLYISKGIHQPNSNPHMQLKLKRDNRMYGGIHLNVSVSDVDIPGLPKEYFHWIGVQFTAEASDGTVKAEWPLVASAHDNKYQHPRRRLSIAPKDVQSMIEAIARDKQEANRKEQARLAQSAMDKTCNEIADKLKAQNLTINGDKKTGLKKLFDGKTIDVTTKRGKTMKVKFEGGVVKQSS